MASSFPALINFFFLDRCQLPSFELFSAITRHCLAPERISILLGWHLLQTLSRRQLLSAPGLLCKPVSSKSFPTETSTKTLKTCSQQKLWDCNVVAGWFCLDTSTETEKLHTCSYCKTFPLQAASWWWCSSHWAAGLCDTNPASPRGGGQAWGKEDGRAHDEPAFAGQPLADQAATKHCTRTTPHLNKLILRRAMSLCADAASWSDMEPGAPTLRVAFDFGRLACPGECIVNWKVSRGCSKSISHRRKKRTRQPRHGADKPDVDVVMQSVVRHAVSVLAPTRSLNAAQNSWEQRTRQPLARACRRASGRTAHVWGPELGPQGWQRGLADVCHPTQSKHWGGLGERRTPQSWRESSNCSISAKLLTYSSLMARAELETYRKDKHRWREDIRYLR